jgi:hypothetical protein
MTLDWTLLVVLFGLIIALVAVLTIIIRGTFKGSVTVAVVSVVGIFAGIGGGSHGPGEILQGNLAPSGIMIEAWPSLTILGGEPAMTLLPSFLVSGVLAIIFGLIVTIWAATCVQRRNGGLVLILLSIMMLLVGGGIIPPIFGIIAGIIGTQIRQIERTSKLGSKSPAPISKLMAQSGETGRR